MNTILIGELDPDLRDQARQAFSTYCHQFELQVVESAKDLKDRLAKSVGDLLILDLDAREGGSLDWLAGVSELRSPISILAVGRNPTPDLAQYEQKFPGRYFPSLKYLQKPVAGEALVEASLHELGHATWGVIQGLGLPSLLQVLNMERKTCTIRVSSGRRAGYFYLRDGQVINGRFRRMEGMEAVQSLIGLAAPKMEIDSHLHDPTQRIDLRLEEILMHAAQFQDESAIEAAAGSLATIPDDSDAIPISEIGKWGRAVAQDSNAKESSRSSHKGPLVAAMVLATVAAAGTWWFTPRSSVVDIRTSPEGAAVSLNGVSQGRTPLRLNVTGPPKGVLSLALSGYQVQQRELTSGDRTLEVTLQALSPTPTVEQPKNPDPPAPVMAMTTIPRAPRKSGSEPKAPSPRKDIFDQLRKQGD